MAPVAPVHPTTRTVHGDEVVDDFAWMADRESPQLAAYLAAENDYAAAMTAHLQPLADEIYDEIRSRTRETDLSVPVAHGGWWYYSRTTEGEQYAVDARVARSPGHGRPDLEAGMAPAGEQVILDENAEAAGHPFFALGASEVSPDGSLLAYAVDVTGEERFDLRVRVIETGQVLDEAVREAGCGAAWSLDGRYVLYTRLDGAWRAHQVWRHEVGTPAEQDVLVVEEPDERFSVSVGASRDDRHILIATGSRTTSEISILDADRPLDAPRVVARRREGVEYDVEPAGDRLLVVHNADRTNFELAWAPLDATSPEQWQPLDVTAGDEYVLGVEAFDRFAVVSLRSDGLTGLRVLPRDPASANGFGAAHDLEFDEPVYALGTGSNPETSTTALQVVFESMVTPRTIYDYDVTTRALTLLKRRPVLGGYDPAQLEQRREWATAPDGTRVPISLVHRRGVEPDGCAPGLLYGYGSYGTSMDPYFSVARLSLLDRGFVFALAHVRGGSEMGRPWYEQGRLGHKATSFTDFLACADHLVESGWVDPDRLAAEGGSAGGLLVGAAVNLAPDRFRVVHAAVPFVDALTTILNPDLPLTVGEWEEWGDPVADPAAYALMKSYTPYENVAPREYPAILVTTSLHDTRVYVTEPAKWVAQLRRTVRSDPGERPILFRTEMASGHAGHSGRYDAWRQHAWETAVIIDRTRPRSGAVPDGRDGPGGPSPG